MAVWILFEKWRSPLSCEPVQKYEYQLLSSRGWGEGVSCGSLGLWRDPRHLPLMWAVSYPASELPRLAGACFLLSTPVLWTNPTLALQGTSTKARTCPATRLYSGIIAVNEQNNPIYPVFLASAMRNEETDKVLWEPSLYEHLRPGPLLWNYLEPWG